VVVEEGEAKRKAAEVEWMTKAVATPALATPPPPPPSPPYGVSGPSMPTHKHRHTFSDMAHRCRCRVVLDEVAIEISRPRSHVEAEGMSRGQTNRSSLHSTTPCGSNDEDILPTLEICLHIAIEVVCHLKMAQERRLLLVEEVSLVDFLLY
jgi:hypothetical protein